MRVFRRNPESAKTKNSRDSRELALKNERRKQKRTKVRSLTKRGTSRRRS